MADDGGQQRKLDFRTAVEDVKAIASVFSMEAESVLGRRTARLLLWTSAIVAVLAISILIGYPYGITLWDWLMLLIVPAALAIGVYWLNQLQTERERNAQAAQRARELEIESERAKDEALEAYLEHMSQLPLQLQSLEDAHGNAQELLMQVARARTLTVLQRLDGRRKRSVLQFLFEGGLIERSDHIIGLRGADLSDAALNEAVLNETDLSGANLSGADLRGADLRGADLRGADLRGADLRGADLREVDLSEANLSGLREADLSKTGLGGKELFLVAGDSLTAPGLRAFGLTNTQMRALFQGIAKLRDANLREAVLTEATVTQTQLLLCDSLQGATMPNGQKYEDWLNSTEGKWFYAAWLRKQGAEDDTNGDP